MPMMHLLFYPINLTQPTHIPRGLYYWEDGTFERDDERRRPYETEEIWYDALEDLQNAILREGVSHSSHS